MVDFYKNRKNNPRDRKKILEIELKFFILKKQTWFEDEK